MISSSFYPRAPAAAGDGTLQTPCVVPDDLTLGRSPLSAAPHCGYLMRQTNADRPAARARSAGDDRRLPADEEEA